MSLKEVYARRKNQLKLDMLKLFQTNLPEKGVRLKNPGRVWTEEKREIALDSKICFNLLLWI